MSVRPHLSLFHNAIIAWVHETNLIEFDSEATDLHQMPDLYKFYDAFKHKIQYKIIADMDLITFLQEYYPDFEFNAEDNNNLSCHEHVYVFALLLYFSCVERKESFFQNAGITIAPTHQKVICKFLSLLTAKPKFDKESLSCIINEILVPCPPLKIFPNIQMETQSQMTPKSTMLNSKTEKIRSLEADLITERYRFEENEAKHQEKLSILLNEIEDLKNSNSALKRELLEKETEISSMTCDVEIDHACQILLKQLSDKNEIIHEFQETIHSLNDENEKLSEKLSEYHERSIQDTNKIVELNDTIHSLEDELNRAKSRNSALENHVEGLNSFIVNSRRLNESLDDNSFCNKDFVHNIKKNTCSDSLETSYDTIASDSGLHHSPLISRRSYSLSHAPILILNGQKNRKFYRSTTYKDNPDRYLSLADELHCHVNAKAEENDLSIFFDSLHEPRRESKVNEQNIQIFETFIEDQSTIHEEKDLDEEEISPACSRLLMKLKQENESLKIANESLALANLSAKRPKRGFKICVIS
uniref:CSON001646 protein n=1 Tax=Culicoides sonorensis TaxID=179676 RepID=A0A336KYU3_CULSO